MEKRKDKFEICKNFNRKSCCMSMFRNGEYECIALSDTYFENGRCPFHKTQKQADEQAAYAENRFAMPQVKVF